jgi:Na+-exporting ATPase
MQKPPQTAGLFTVEFLADTLTYGLIMGTITLISFVLTLYVFKDGDIGVNCNEVGDDSLGCAAVYESRSVPFLLLSVMLLWHAINLKDRRKPIWRISVFNNKWLLAAIGIG